MGVSQLLLLSKAGLADANWVVPAARWHRACSGRALVADALPAGTTVMNLELNTERLLAHAAILDLLVRHPVSGSGCITNRH